MQCKVQQPCNLQDWGMERCHSDSSILALSLRLARFLTCHAFRLCVGQDIHWESCSRCAGTSGGRQDLEASTPGKWLFTAQRWSMRRLSRHESSKSCLSQRPTCSAKKRPGAGCVARPRWLTGTRETWMSPRLCLFSLQKPFARFAYRSEDGLGPS